MRSGMPTDDPPQWLDPRQLEAVSAAIGPVAVIGEAGSGKTTVVVERAAWLVRSGVPRSEILVLALSRANAEELTGHLAPRLGKYAPQVTTIHSFCFDCVRSHYREAGYTRPPRRSSAREAWQHLKQALERKSGNLAPYRQETIRLRTSLALINDLVAGAANNDLDSAGIKEALLACGRGDLAGFAGFVQRYRSLTKREGLLDDEGALLQALHLFRSASHILQQYRTQHPHVLVDEFEQATYAQALLVRLLASEGLFVAGNPEQATNSYRGGSPAYLRELEVAEQTRLVRLETVYRGSPAIQFVWRRVLSGDTRHNIAPALATDVVPRRVQDPTLQGYAHSGEPCPTGAVGYSGLHASPGEVVVKQFENQRDEAGRLARGIGFLVGSGTLPKEIAVLFRRGGDPIARELANRLVNRGLPVRAMAEAVSVASDPMVASAVEVLRFFEASSIDRNLLFLRLLSSPLGGLTPAEVRSVQRLAAQRKQSLMSLALAPDSLDSLPPNVAEYASALATRLHELEAHGDEPPDEMLWRIWTAFPAFAHQARAWADGRPQGAPGIPMAFRVLLDEVTRIVGDTPSTTVNDIVRLFEAGHFRELTVVPPDSGREGVQLATIHESRGKEWRYVFVPNVVEDVYPLRRSPVGNLAPILLRARDGETESIRERHLAEERRILGVALSRARERLWISFSKTALDGTTRLVPSRFLQQLGFAEDTEAGHGIEADPVEEAMAGYRRQLWRLSMRQTSSGSRPDDSFPGARASCPHVQGDYRQTPDVSPGGRLDAAAALYALSRLAEVFPDKVDPSGWWDLVEETRGASPPYPDGYLYLSASRLAAYRDCPLKYKYAHHIALEDVANDAMSMGSLLHSVLEEYHRPGNSYERSPQTLQFLLDSKFDESAFSCRAVARQVRLKASQLLDLYFPLYGWRGAALEVEQQFRFRLDRITISGRIDRIDRLQDGSLELIDYKTGSPMSQADAMDDLQLALYELAFHHDSRLAALGRPSLVTYLYPKGISEKLAAKLAEDGGPPAKIPARGNGKRSYLPTEDSRRMLRSRIERYSGGILAEQFPSRSQIAQTWPDLDQGELNRLQKANPCRVCGFQWLCPESEREASDV